MQRLVIGTRGSKLARWQAGWAKARLQELHPELQIEIRVITTKGDRILDVSLPKLGEQGKGLFTKELEDEMLEGQIDVAVHSLKDLPVEITGGLHIAAISEREDVRDALVARPSVGSFNSLALGARVGTSSLRRQSQIKSIRPDLVLEPVRGNVDTRIRKVEEGLLDAVILASAGLHRLGRKDQITEYLNETLLLPAVGQGALAIQTRLDDTEVNQAVAPLNHEPSRLACVAERAMLAGLGGGCLVPIAALARISGTELKITGLVASADGTAVVRGQTTGLAAEAEKLGASLSSELMGRGAGALLTHAPGVLS